MTPRHFKLFTWILCTVRTVFNSLFQTAFSYSTNFTKWDHDLSYTSIAVDILWFKRKIIRCPSFSGLFSQFIIIRLFSDISGTFITQKSTKCYYFFFRHENTFIFSIHILLLNILARKASQSLNSAKVKSI